MDNFLLIYGHDTMNFQRFHWVVRCGVPGRDGLILLDGFDLFTHFVRPYDCASLGSKGGVLMRKVSH